jgi:hypothetical protein
VTPHAPPSRTFLEVPRETRQRIEAVVETLINLLDLLDGDCDLEDGHDAERDPAEAGLADRDALDEFLWDAQRDDSPMRLADGTVLAFRTAPHNARAMAPRRQFPRRQR